MFFDMAFYLKILAYLFKPISHTSANFGYTTTVNHAAFYSGRNPDSRRGHNWHTLVIVSNGSRRRIGQQFTDYRKASALGISRRGRVVF